MSHRNINIQLVGDGRKLAEGVAAMTRRRYHKLNVGRLTIMWRRGPMGPPR